MNGKAKKKNPTKAKKPPKHQSTDQFIVNITKIFSIYYIFQAYKQLHIKAKMFKLASPIDLW